MVFAQVWSFGEWSGDVDRKNASSWRKFLTPVRSRSCCSLLTYLAVFSERLVASLDMCPPGSQLRGDPLGLQQGACYHVGKQRDPSGKVLGFLHYLLFCFAMCASRLWCWYDHAGYLHAQVAAQRCGFDPSSSKLPLV